MTAIHTIVPEDEFADAQIGDLRLNARVVRVVRAIASSPSSSLPQIFQDPSQLEGAYRLLANINVTPQALFDAHRLKTLARAKLSDSVLIIHDSSSFAFGGGSKKGMGVVDPFNIPGFYSHFSLCVAASSGRPLGLGWMHLWNRPDVIHGKRSQQSSQYDPDRESLRWNDAVQISDEELRLCGLSEVIHVMDREADCMELLADMIAHQRDFVVRARIDRRLEPGQKATTNKLTAFFESLEASLLSQVDIRKYKTKMEIQSKAQKATSGKEKATVTKERKRKVSELIKRVAQLEIRAARLTLYAGSGGHAHVPKEGLTVNVVEVKESDNSLVNDLERVHWMLLSTLPINESSDIEKIISIYKKRWQIEEFHKALKTGCKFEEHQFEHGERYAKMLIMYVPIAIKMLQLRWMTQHTPDAPASEVLDQDELEALVAHEATRRKPLSSKATVSETLLVVARLGGHLPHNGPPGWLILSRGFDYLHKITTGWRLARPSFAPPT